MEGGHTRPDVSPSGPTHPCFDLIVVAASAGGLEALLEIVPSLPVDFPVPIAVVVHRSLQAPEMLATVLGRRTSLEVRTAAAGETPRAGTVYVAPPDRHLVVTPDRTFALQHGQRVQHTHSAADPLFLSAALVYGDRAMAIVLSGGQSDGAAGARAIGDAGGFVLVQNEATSRVFSMPSAAIATGQVEAVLPVGDIAAALVSLVWTRTLS
jgi:two-component system chemotaxis response regulator CheB